MTPEDFFFFCRQPPSRLARRGKFNRGNKTKWARGQLLRFESLEDRTMLAFTVDIVDDVLKITGSGGADAIGLVRRSANPSLFDVLDAGVPVASGPFALADFQQIEVLGQGGNDTLTIDTQHGLLAGNFSIRFDGGEQPGDADVLQVIGPLAFGVHNPGELVSELGGATQRVAYVGVESVTELSPPNGTIRAILLSIGHGLDALSTFSGVFDAAPQWSTDPAIPGTPGLLGTPLPLIGTSLGAALNGPDPANPGEASSQVVRRVFQEGGLNLEAIGESIRTIDDLRLALEALGGNTADVVVTAQEGVWRFDLQVTQTLRGQAMIDTTQFELDEHGAPVSNAADRTVSLVGTADLSADVVVHLSFGVDQNGFFLDAGSHVDPHVLIQNIQLSSIVAEGAFGALGVTLQKDNVAFDPGIAIGVRLQKAGGNIDNSLMRTLDFNATSPTDTAIVTLAASPNPDLQFDATFQVDAFPGGGPLLVAPEVNLSWPDIRMPQVVAASGQDVAGEQLVGFLNVTPGQLAAGLVALAGRLNQAGRTDLLGPTVDLIGTSFGAALAAVTDDDTSHDLVSAVRAVLNPPDPSQRPTTLQAVATQLIAAGFTVDAPVLSTDPANPSNPAIELNILYTADPVALPARLGFGDLIGGLQLDGANAFDLTVTPTFHLPFGLLLADSLSQADPVAEANNRVFLAVDGSPVVSLAVTANVADPDITGTIGFLNVKLTEQDSGGAGFTLGGAVTVELVDPNTSSAPTPERITLSELLAPDDLSQVFTPASDGLSFVIDDLQLTANLNSAVSSLGAVSIALDPADGQIADIADLSNLLSRVTIDHAALAGFQSYENITPDTVLGGLTALVAQLSDFSANGVLAQPLPLVNTTVGQLVDFGQTLADRLGPLDDSMVVATAQAAQQFLSDNLGPMDVVVGPDGVAYSFVLTESIAGSFPVSLDAGSNRVHLELPGELPIRGEAVFHVTFGIRTADQNTPLGERIFLGTGQAHEITITVTGSAGYDLNDDGVLNAADAEHAPIQGTIQLGQLPGVDVVDGRVLIRLAMDGDLSSGAVADRVTLQEIAHAVASDDLATLLNATIDGDVQAIVPLDGNGGGVANDPALLDAADARIEVAGSLANADNFAFDTGLIPHHTAPAGTAGNALGPNPGIDDPLGPSPLDASRILIDSHNLDSFLSGLTLNLDDLDDGLDAFLAQLKNALDERVLGKVPLVDPLTNGLSFIDDIRAQLVSLSGLADPSAIKTALFNILGPLGLLASEDDITIIDPEPTEAVRFEMTLQKAVPLSAPFRSGLGFDSLPLDVLGNAEITLNFGYDLAFGTSRVNGFFVDTSDPVMLDLTVSLPGGDVTGQLGFLNLAISAATPELFEGTFTVDVQDPSQDGLLTLSELAMITGQGGLGDWMRPRLDATGADAGVHADWDLTARLGDPGDASSPALISTNFTLDWTFANTDPSAGLLGSVPEINFGSVQLHVDTFFGQMLQPIAEIVDAVLGPIEPVTDVLNARLPVISDLLGSRVTLLTLAQTLPSGFVEGGEFLEAVVFLSELADALGGISATGTIDVGSFTFGGADPRTAASLVHEIQAGADVPASLFERFNQSTSGADADKLERFVAGTVPGAGLAFPIFEDPEKVFQLLLGQHFDMFTYRMPSLRAGFEYEQKFPIIPPLFATLTGTVGATFDFAFGADTTGFEEVATSGNPADVFAHGFFVDTGQPQVTLDAGIFAGAALSVVVAEASVNGGISANVNFTLDGDPDNNDDAGSDEANKLRVHEAADFFNNNPLCLFDVRGGLNAELFAKIKIGLDTPFGFVTLFSDRYDIASIELLDFGHIGGTCDPGAPNVAALDGGTLTLLMGNAASSPPTGDPRNVGLDANGNLVEEEVFVVTYDVADDSIVVSAFGFEERFEATNVDQIVANGGSADDTIIVSQEVLTRMAALGAGPILVNLLGGEGRDTINVGFRQEEPSSGPAVDFSGFTTMLRGGAGDDLLAGSDLDDRLLGDEGNDQIIGGLGVDAIDGGDGNDVLQGGDGDDTIDGGAGDDDIAGGAGKDMLDGESGQDVIRGDAGADNIFGGEGDDAIQAGDGSDTLEGESGNDLLFGGLGQDTIKGGAGDDQIDGGQDNDTIHGGTGHDTIAGGDGDDRLDGDNFLDLDNTNDSDDGDDVLLGGAGSDELMGAGGNDLLDGADGDDRLFGLGGDDTLIGGPGNDTLTGGTLFGVGPETDGNDTFVFAGGMLGTDQVFEANDCRGRDRLDFSSFVAPLDPLDLRLASPQTFGDALNPDLVLTLSGTTAIEDVMGTAFRDEILGNSCDNSIAGQGDDDTLIGFEGDDILIGGLGSDTLEGREGDDVLIGDEGAAVVGTRRISDESPAIELNVGVPVPLTLQEELSTTPPGLFVAAGDVNGDGFADMITAPTSEQGDLPVQVFSGADRSLLRSFLPFGGPPDGGVTVAAADVNGDGHADIITGASEFGSSSTAQIRVFSGKDGSQIADFQAHPVTNFRDTVFVAAGDVDGDGVPEIVTSIGSHSASPQVRVFHKVTGGWELLNEFDAYPGVATGVLVAVGDVDGAANGRSEIVTARLFGASQIQVFRADGTLAGSLGSAGAVGVAIAVADIDGDGRAELITGQADGGTAVTRRDSTSGAFLEDFEAFPGFVVEAPPGSGMKVMPGISIASADVTGDGTPDYVVGTRLGQNLKCFDGKDFTRPCIPDTRLVIAGENTSDDLFGDDGNDILIGDSGVAALLSVVVEADTLAVPLGNAPRVLHQGNVHQTGFAGDVEITGRAGNDTLIASSGDDTLIGDNGVVVVLRAVLEADLSNDNANGVAGNLATDLAPIPDTQPDGPLAADVPLDSQFNLSYINAVPPPIRVHSVALEVAPEPPRPRPMPPIQGVVQKSLIGILGNLTQIGITGNVTIRGEAGVDTFVGGAGNDALTGDNGVVVGVVAGSALFAGHGAADPPQATGIHIVQIGVEGHLVQTGIGGEVFIDGDAMADYLDQVSTDHPDADQGNDILTGDNGALVAVATGSAVVGNVPPCDTACQTNPVPMPETLIAVLGVIGQAGVVGPLTLIGQSASEGNGGGALVGGAGNDVITADNALVSTVALVPWAVPLSPVGGTANSASDGDVPTLPGGQIVQLFSYVGNISQTGVKQSAQLLTEGQGASDQPVPGEGNDLVIGDNLLAGTELFFFELTIPLPSPPIGALAPPVLQAMEGPAKLAGAGPGEPLASAGNDTLHGGAGIDILMGDNQVLSLHLFVSSLPEEITLKSAAGDDELRGGDDADLLLGDNWIIGAVPMPLGSPQTLSVQTQLGDDVLDGGAGIDALMGDSGISTLPTSANFPFFVDDQQLGVTIMPANTARGKDQLMGGTGVDFLFGQNQDDELLGGDDIDLLVGGGDNDRLQGDAGDDIYWFNNGWGDDTVEEPAGDSLDSLVFPLVTVPVEFTMERDAASASPMFASDRVVARHLADPIDPNSAVLNRVTHQGDNLEFLFGGLVNDSFVFQDQAGLAGGAGVVNGGFGLFFDSDTLDYFGLRTLGQNAYQTAVTVDLASGLATGTGAADPFLRGVFFVENVIGGDAGDNLRGDLVSNILIGMDGDDTLEGRRLLDVLIGGRGADTLVGGLEPDIYTFFDDWGHDTVVENPLVTIFDKADTFLFSHVDGPGGLANLFPKVDQDLSFTIEPGSLAVTDGTNTVDHAGNHVEWLGGGPKQDSFTLRNQAVLGQGFGLVHGGEGTDTLDYSQYGASVTVDLEDPPGIGFATGIGVPFLLNRGVFDIQNVIGSDFNDNLIGDSGPNVLTGGLGNDALGGRGGSDTYWFGDGFGMDTVVELPASGLDKLDFSSVTENLFITRFNTSLQVTNGVFNTVNHFGDAVEHVVGGLADDLFSFEDGALLAAGLGTFDGGGGVNNTLNYFDYTVPVGVDLSNNAALGLAQVRRIQHVIGGTSHDHLTGDGGANALFGGAGNDVLQGLHGDDVLAGNAGTDVLEGGAGNDTYAFEDGWGHDQVRELPGGGDDTMSFIFSLANLIWTLGSVRATDGANIAEHNGDEIEHLIGSIGNDTFVFEDQAQLADGTGTIDGGPGSNTLNYAAYSTFPVVDLSQGIAEGTGGVSNIQNVIFPLNIVDSAPFLLDGLVASAAASLPDANGLSQMMAEWARGGFFGRPVSALPAAPGVPSPVHLSAARAIVSGTRSGHAAHTGLDGLRETPASLAEMAMDRPAMSPVTLFHLAANLPTFETDSDVPAASLAQLCVVDDALRLLLGAHPLTDVFCAAGQPVPEAIVLDAGPAAGDGLPDTIEVVANADTVDVIVNGQLTQQIPYAAVLTLTVQGSADDDTLIVDHTARLLSAPIHFLGGEGNNKLTIQGNASGTGNLSEEVFFTPTRIDLNGTGVTFEDVGCVDLNGVTAAHYVFDLTDTADQALFRGMAGGGVSLQSTTGTFPRVDFAGPSESIVINTGGGGDTIVLGPFAAPFTRLLTIDGGAPSAANGDSDQLNLDLSWLTAPIVIPPRGGMIQSAGHEDIHFSNFEQVNITGGAQDVRAGDLYIGGSPKHDNIVVSNRHGSPGKIEVLFNGRLLGPFGPANRVVVNGRTGHDHISAGHGFSTPVRFYGDAGNDVLNGGRGDDVIEGGPGNDKISGDAGNDILRGDDGHDHLFAGLGNDVLIGGKGNDHLLAWFGTNILIGGGGRDHLSGQFGGNLLIGGRTTHDANDQALLALLAEWSSVQSIDNRIKHLMHGGGRNGDVVLTPAGTVLDDKDLDDLLGGLGADWFFQFNKDRVWFRGRNDRVTSR